MTWPWREWMAPLFVSVLMAGELIFLFHEQNGEPRKPWFLASIAVDRPALPPPTNYHIASVLGIRVCKGWERPRYEIAFMNSAHCAL